MAPLDMAGDSVESAVEPVSNRARNTLLALAFLLQLPTVWVPFLVTLTWPAGVALLFAAAVCHGYFRKQWAWAVGLFFGATVVQTAFALGATIIADLLGNGFRRGRQVRDDKGRVVLADVREGPQWWKPQTVSGVPAHVREALAEQWRDNGLTEHASVAAFARLQLELLELGAPAALIEAAQRDGQDELRHTELCFAVAHAIDGQSKGPGEFPRAERPPRARTRVERLARLAVDSLFDGVLHEGVSARIIAKLARKCEISAITDVLVELSRDEGRHAAHARDVVKWCIEQGGAPVLEALRGAASALPASLAPTQRRAAWDGAWERYGVHGNALGAQCYEAAVTALRLSL